jgi:hypothetical protein
MPEACGAAIAAGNSSKQVGFDPQGRSGSASLALMFALEGPLVPGTYDVMDPSLSFFDSQCAPERAAQQATGTVQIMDAPPDRVVGIVSLEDMANARSFSGMFDVPTCPLPEQPATRCCVQ